MNAKLLNLFYFLISAVIIIISHLISFQFCFSFGNSDSIVLNHIEKRIIFILKFLSIKGNGKSFLRFMASFEINSAHLLLFLKKVKLSIMQNVRIHLHITVRILTQLTYVSKQMPEWLCVREMYSFYYTSAIILIKKTSVSTIKS